MSNVPIAEIYVDEAQGWLPIDVQPSTAAPIQVYQPPPSAPARAAPPGPRVTVPDSNYFDATKPNHVNVPPRDWTPEIRELNDLIDRDLEQAGLDAVADAEWADYIGGRRGRNLAGQVMDAIPLLDDAAAIAGIAELASDATGTVVAPWQYIPAIANPSDGLLDYLNPLNWFGQARPVESGTFEGEPAFDGGQCPFDYNVRLNATWTSDDRVGVQTSSTGNAFLEGPLNFISGPALRRAVGQGGGQVQLDLSSRDNPVIQSFSWDVTPKNSGDVDNCGAPQGEPVQQPVTTQPYNPVDFTDNPSAPTVPDVDLPDIPDISPDIPGVEGDEPTTGPDGENPFPDGQPDNPGSPELPDTNPGGGGNGGDGDGREENLSCCEKIDFLFKAGGSGEPCEDISGQKGYEGTGLDGVYLAIQRIWDAVKCPDENIASLPTYYETRVGEVPQLIVQWKRVSGGSSRWDFHIPHPKESIGREFAFNFPSYYKGSYQATMRMTDNSTVIINALDKENAGIIMRYIRTLIDPQFLRTYKDNNFPFVGSELNRTMVTDEVEACYVKSFQGHLNATPLWAKSV